MLNLGDLKGGLTDVYRQSKPAFEGSSCGVYMSCELLVTTSKAPVTTSVALLVTTSKALVSTSFISFSRTFLLHPVSHMFF